VCLNEADDLHRLYRYLLDVIRSELREAPH
jgi:hypothetical protein